MGSVPETAELNKTVVEQYKIYLMYSNIRVNIQYIIINDVLIVQQNFCTTTNNQNQRARVLKV